MTSEEVTDTWVRTPTNKWERVRDGFEKVMVMPPPTVDKPWFSHIDERARGGNTYGVGDFDWFPQNETILKAQLTSPPAFVGQFFHGYSGDSIPTSFATSTVAPAEAMGIGAMLNTKRTNWTALANGNYDQNIRDLFNSWPVSVYGSVTINHEPENDTVYGGPGSYNPATSGWVAWADAYAPIWKNGINRFIDVAAPIIRSRGLDVKVGACLMDGSWDVGGQQWWNWWDELTPANINEVAYMIDLYYRHSTAGVAQTVASKLDRHLSEMRSVGIKSFELWETNIDRRSSLSKADAPITGTEATCTAFWKTFATRLMAEPETRMVCEYHIPTGPASSQGWLMGAGAVSGGNNNSGGTLKAFADICMAGKRGA